MGYTALVEWIPFRDAARRQGISEDALRRKILMGEIESRPVDDHRHYLVQAPVPSRRSRRRWAALLALVPLLMLAYLGGCVGVLHMNYVCTECGQSRRTEELLILGGRVTLTEEIRPSEISEWLGQRDRRDCSHSWLFAIGGGGPFA